MLNLKKTTIVLVSTFVLLLLLVLGGKYIVLPRIFVSAVDSIGFMIPTNYEVRGPAKRSGDCIDSETQEGCKLYNEYTILNPEDQSYESAVLKVYNEPFPDNSQTGIILEDKNIIVIGGDNSNLSNSLISSIGKVDTVNTGNCVCYLCSGSCTKLKSEQVLCGTPPEENYNYCAQNYCVDEGNECKGINNIVLKREFVRKNILKVLRNL